MNKGYLGKEWRQTELSSKNEHEHTSEVSKRTYGLPTVRGRRVSFAGTPLRRGLDEK